MNEIEDKELLAIKKVEIRRLRKIEERIGVYLPEVSECMSELFSLIKERNQNGSN